MRALVVSLVVISFSGGCHNQPKRTPYDGPTDPITRVVDDINQNNQRVRTIWASGDFKAWIPDDKGRQHFVDGDAFVLYQAPGDLLLKGKKFGVGDVFQIGTNGQNYWLIVKPEIDTMWHGDYSRTPKDAQEMPIRPDLLLEVLGVGTIDTDLARQPAPVMRFNNDERAYMLVWIVKASSPPDRLIAQKEVWYDVTTKRPRLVLLFDEDGRIVLRAYLSDPKPVEGNWPQGKAPFVAGRFDLYFPLTKTKMQLTLNDVRERYKGLPTDASFRFPGANAAAKTINIDEARSR